MSKNGGKAGLDLDSVPFPCLQMKLGKVRTAASSLAADSCKNKYGTVGANPSASCMSFGSWKAQNVRKKQFLGKHKQYDTVQYNKLQGKDLRPSF